MCGNRCHELHVRKKGQVLSEREQIVARVDADFPVRLNFSDCSEKLRVEAVLSTKENLPEPARGPLCPPEFLQFHLLPVPLLWANEASASPNFAETHPRGVTAIHRLWNATATDEQP